MFGLQPISNTVKDAYALELAKHPGGEALKAALAVTDGDLSISMQLINECAIDPNFADRQRQLVEDSGAELFLPSKELVAFEILNIARRPELEIKLALAAYEQFCIIMGYIQKGGGININNINNRVNNKVMMIPTPIAMDDWEARAVELQRQITHDARAKDA